MVTTRGLNPQSSGAMPRRREMEDDARDMETMISRAMRARIRDFKDQADLLTLVRVRRSLEKDMGLKKFTLDAHKRFIKQCLHECFSELDDENFSKNMGKNSEQVVHSEETEGDNSEKILSEDTIKKAIKKRASYFRDNSETITLSGARRLLEEDLKLEKNALDAYKIFISKQLDEVLQSPEVVESMNGYKKKGPKKASDSKVRGGSSKGSRKVSRGDGRSDSSDASSSGEEGVEDQQVKQKKQAVKKVAARNTEWQKKRKRSTVKRKPSSNEKNKPAKSAAEKGNGTDEGGNSSEDGKSQSSAEEPVKKKRETSSQVYGKRVEHLRSIIKACRMSIPPSVYKRAKQAPKNKREAHLIKELEEILGKEGLSSNPSEKEIKEVKKQKKRAKLGIDMSNIVSSSRRRSTSNFIFPPPKPRLAVEENGGGGGDDEESESEDAEIIEGPSRISVNCPIRHLDSQPEALGTHLLGVTDASEARVVPASSSSRKRGPTRGASLDVQPDRKKVLKTNEFGQPNEDCPNHRDFASHIGVLTRTHIPIIYQDFRHVPRTHIQTVTDTLSQFYEFEGQSWDASLIYVTRRINDTWRNYKKRLTAKYIKDNDPAVVREGPAPLGVSMEDWRVFVDQHNTEQFKGASARNKVNRAKLKGPACLGRRSMAVTRHQMAMERNLTSDAEVGRSDVYLRAHTSKDNVVQFPDLAEKLNELYRSNPASRMTGVDDALAQLLGPDSRGQMRGLGCSVSKTGLKKSAPARSKVETVTKEKECLEQQILEIKKTLADINAWMGVQQEARSVQNPSTPPAARSTQASSDMVYIGKRCDLLGWGKRGVVARGQVHEVDPNAIVHSQPLEEGAFVVVLTEIIQPDAPLWNEDGFTCTLGEAGLGSFVQWGKDSLRVQ